MYSAGRHGLLSSIHQLSDTNSSGNDANAHKVTKKGVVSSTLTIGLARTLSRLLGFVTSFFVFRMLGAAEYGLASAAYALPALIGFFGDLGIGTGTVKFASQYLANNEMGKAKALYQFNALAKTLTSVPVFALSISLSYWWAQALGQPEALLMFQLGCFITLTNAAAGFSSNVMISFSKPRPYAIQIFMVEGLRFVLTLSLLSLGFGYIGLVLGYLVSLGASGVFGSIIAVQCIRSLRQPATLDSKIIRQMMAYGFKSAMGTLSVLAINNVFASVILGFSGSMLLGYYSATNKIASVLGVLGNS
ncbi:MAG: oligosaccharide flippase family protein, partial [Candidatus Ranarchaeia archaeon]